MSSYGENIDVVPLLLSYDSKSRQNIRDIAKELSGKTVEGVFGFIEEVLFAESFTQQPEVARIYLGGLLAREGEYGANTMLSVNAEADLRVEQSDGNIWLKWASYAIKVPATFIEIFDFIQDRKHFMISQVSELPAGSELKSHTAILNRLIDLGLLTFVMKDLSGFEELRA